MATLGDITACGLLIRPHEHAVVANGRDVDLTPREFEIIFRLAEHPGWVMSPEQLASQDEAAEYSPESVSVLVSRVRSKLGLAGASDVVETVRGLGYRLRLPRDGWEPLNGADTGGSLREASWYLQEAVFEVEHAGTEQQRKTAADALESARRAIYAALAERP